MKKVTLYHLKNDKLSINIVAYFNEEGDLKIDGHDLGTMKGGRDYEYFITVEKRNLEALTKSLKTKTDSLLLTLQQNFNDNYAFSNFKKFLEENDIPFKQFYWN